MDYEKLVADLKDWLPPESEKIPYGELVGAPYPYNLQGPSVYSDEVCNLVEEAADAITALLDENARLKTGNQCGGNCWRRLKAPLAGGTKERRTLMDYEKLIEQLKQKDGLWCSVHTGEKLVTDAADALTALLAENERLRAELEQKSKLIAQQAAELERRDKLLKEQEIELDQMKRENETLKHALQNWHEEDEHEVD